MEKIQEFLRQVGWKSEIQLSKTSSIIFSILLRTSFIEIFEQTIYSINHKPVDEHTF